MKVLIVSKTRRGSRACVGGITLDGESIRLIAINEATNEQAGMEYAVGDVWDVNAKPADGCIPPHVENVIVSTKRRCGRMSSPVDRIETHMPPKNGGIDALFDGLTQATSRGALYITERIGTPPI